MELDADVLIIGGGIAGLTCAIHLSKLNWKVLLIEKNEYPQHKVCGEYISNEVLPYLRWLEADPAVLEPAIIDTFQFTTATGQSVTSKLPLGGFGISRYRFDEYLFQKAKQNGCVIIKDLVSDVTFNNEQFKVSTATKTYHAKLVLGAYGKRSALDHKLNRGFITRKSDWLAIKGHYEGEFPKNLVALHHFQGGYCGVSTVEKNIINICYLVNYKSFKKYKDIVSHQHQVLYQNVHLKAIMENSKPLFDVPLSISQISFAPKSQADNQIIMIGDSAGLIHPLCGNGMSMAITAAKICTELVHQYFKGEIPDRTALFEQYQKQWKAHFRSRLRSGRWLSSILSNEPITSFLMNGLAKYPRLLSLMISTTHGKPLTNRL